MCRKGCFCRIVSWLPRCRWCLYVTSCSRLKLFLRQVCLSFYQGLLVFSGIFCHQLLTIPCGKGRDLSINWLLCELTRIKVVVILTMESVWSYWASILMWEHQYWECVWADWSSALFCWELDFWVTSLFSFDGTDWQKPRYPLTIFCWCIYQGFYRRDVFTLSERCMLFGFRWHLGRGVLVLQVVRHENLFILTICVIHLWNLLLFHSIYQASLLDFLLWELGLVLFPSFECFFFGFSSRDRQDRIIGDMVQVMVGKRWAKGRQLCMGIRR